MGVRASKGMGDRQPARNRTPAAIVRDHALTTLLTVSEDGASVPSVTATI